VFGVSDKGGIGETRNPWTRIPGEWHEVLKNNRSKVFNLGKGNLLIEKDDFTP
jgi:hypothetical protein